MKITRLVFVLLLALSVAAANRRGSKNRRSGEGSPPAIVTHPKLKAVEKGRSIILECEATGNPTPKITWKKDRRRVDEADSRIKISTKGLLQIDDARESDEGTYQCAARNDFGVKWSSKANVYVKVRRVPPKFSERLDSVVLAAPASDLNISCRATGSPTPSVRWRQGTDYLEDVSEAPLGKNVLQLKNVRENNTYTCEASSILNTIEQSVSVVVKYAYPVIVKHPKLTAVAKGRQLVLECETSGNPLPQITWYNNQVVITENDPRVKITSQGSLHINDTRDSDEGTYQCRASNILGDALSLKAKVYVKVDIRTWYCLAGWEEYVGSESENATCIYFGQKNVDFYSQNGECAKYGANPVNILSKAKNDFITGLLEKNDSINIYWLNLIKYRSDMFYSSPLLWVDNDLNAIDYFVPEPFLRQVDDLYEQVYIYLSRTGWDAIDYSGLEYSYICEKDAVCYPGWTGDACATKCHCAGEACDLAREEPTCRFGCEKGWSGPYCTEKREEPEVRYFCINSPDEDVGSYVDIYILTKGIYYRNIHARNNETRSDWCAGTNVTEDTENFGHVTIKIPINSNEIEEMQQGNCAGKVMGPNQYEWQLVVQEYEGIMLDTDVKVIISCDFDKSESLQRSVSFSREGTDVDLKAVKVTAENADVNLEVVDPFTREPISEATVGTPAKLQISFGYLDGSLVRGVHPHQCVASTADGSLIKQLVDENGCASPGSPVAEFINSDGNATDLLSTDWFQIFAFEGHDSVEFRCSFDICVETTEGCEPGCRKHSHAHRHRREAPFPESENVDDFSWRSSVIHILPGAYDMGKNELQHGNEIPSTTRESSVRSHPGKKHNKDGDATPQVVSPASDSVWQWVNPAALVIKLLLLLIIIVTVALTFYLSLARGITGLRREMAEWMYRRDARERVISHTELNRGYVKGKNSAVVV